MPYNKKTLEKEKEKMEEEKETDYYLERRATLALKKRDNLYLRTKIYIKIVILYHFIIIISRSTF